MHIIKEARPAPREAEVIVAAWAINITAEDSTPRDIEDIANEIDYCILSPGRWYCDAYTLGDGATLDDLTAEIRRVVPGATVAYTPAQVSTCEVQLRTNPYTDSEECDAWEFATFAAARDFAEAIATTAAVNQGVYLDSTGDTGEGYHITVKYPRETE